MLTASFLSGSMKDVLSKNPQMAADFIEELINLHRNGEHDARHGKSQACKASPCSQTKDVVAPSSYTAVRSAGLAG